jgi:hypothetical protein
MPIDTHFLRSRFLVSLSVLALVSCASNDNSAHLDPLGPVNPLHGYNPFAPQSPLADKVVAEWRDELSKPGVLESTQDAPARNKLVYRLIFLSDYRFSKYQSDLVLGKATRDSFVDLSVFGLTSAATLLTPGSATQVLSAIASGFSFSRSNIEKNFFQNQATPVLIAKMMALRKEKFNEIVSRLNLPYEKYPTELAIIDVLDYYNRGTMTGALQAISGDTAVQEIKNAGGDVTPPPTAPSLGVQLGASSLEEFSSRRHPQKVVLGLTPPKSVSTTVIIPPELVPRNIRLQRAFPITEDDAAKILKKHNVEIPDKVLPSEQLAQSILSAANPPLTLNAGATALASLTRYRREADTGAKTKQLEDAYSKFLDLPELGASDLQARFLRMKNTFDKVKPGDATKILANHSIKPKPGEEPLPALAAQILAAANPPLTVLNNDPIVSLTSYRNQGRTDEQMTVRLEDGYKAYLKLPPLPKTSH